MSDDTHVFEELEAPFDPLHDLRHRQTLFAVLAALFAGVVIGLNFATGMAVGGMPEMLYPDWVSTGEWLMWMAAVVALMAAAGWLSTDYARLNDDE